MKKKITIFFSFEGVALEVGAIEFAVGVPLQLLVCFYVVWLFFEWGRLTTGSSSVFLFIFSFN